MFKVKLLRFLLKIFYIFPVNKRKVFFSSFEGKSIACNPKYIYEYMKEQNYDLKYIWECNNRKGKGYVKHNSLGYIFHILTSKYVISNNSVSPVLPIRRKKQIVVNTWHGAGAYKKIGKYVDSKVNGTDMDRQRMINAQTTCFFAGSKMWSEVVSDSIDFLVEKFIPTGMARNSIFYKDIDKIALKKKFGFDADTHVCLYAPTFRGNTGESRDENYAGLDAERVVKALEKRFGGKWVFATRCHYHTHSQKLANSIDLSSAEDMQELLVFVDMLISDYSSSIWDFCLTLKPCILYCYDLDKYKSERDFYVPIEEWGFPIANDLESLIKVIENFDKKDFKEKMLKHQKDQGSYEGIDAPKKAVEYLFNYKLK